MSMPQFAAGELYKIQSAIDVGVLKYPAWVYVRDKNMMAFIDQDSSINLIEGNNKSVLNIDKLPDTSEASKDILYILDGIVYTFNGTEFKPMYKDVTVELEQIKEQIEALTGRITTLEEIAHSPIQWVKL